MISNTTIPAPVSVLAFLALAGTLMLGSITVIALSFSRKYSAARLVANVEVAAFVCYFAALLTVSAMSRENVLQPGQAKYFCELDCHLAYSVAGVREQADASGKTISYIVTLRTFFDPSTISQQRPKDAPLSPNLREIYLVDKYGHAYHPVSSSGTALTTRLKPGDSYTTDLAFQPEQPLAQPRLLVAAAGWEQQFLIGAEGSWLHRKAYFGLT